MYFLTIFLVYLLGICLLRLLDNRWSLAEWLGFSFPGRVSVGGREGRARWALLPG